MRREQRELERFLLVDVKQMVDKHREMQKSTTDFNKNQETSSKGGDSPYLSPAGKRREKLKD